MYQKMISGVGSTTSDSKKNIIDKTKKSSTENKTNNNNNTFFSYLATAGVVVAIASIGFAAYAKYKNLI
jgi:hypothetical protein